MTGWATTWRVATAVGRSHLRRHWVGLIAIGVLAGLAAGVAFGALAVAYRTTSAPDRLDAATRLDDARVTLFGGSGLEDEITALPGVRSSWVTGNAVGQIEGGGRRYVSVTFGADRPSDLFTPVFVQGRMPADDAVDEIAVAESLAEAADLTVGDRLPLRMLLAEEVYQFDTGFGQPDGPLLDLEVTGVIRMSAASGNGFGPVFAGPAFEQRWAELSAGPTLLLRLEPDPQAREELEAGLAALRDADDAPVTDFGPLAVVYPDDRASPQISTARRVLGGGLLLFALVAAAAGLLATTQAAARQNAVGAADQRVEAAVGLVRAERVLGRVLPGLVAVAVAAALAAVGVLVAGAIGPLGALAGFEPEPGWLPDVGLAVAAATVTAVVVLVVFAVTAARAGRPTRSRSHARTPMLPRMLFRRAPAVAGASFAFGGSPTAGGARPSRATVVGVVLGITGVVATATFSAGLARLEAEPGRYGWNADFGVVDARPADLERLAADPEVGDAQLVGDSTVQLEGELVPAQVLEDVSGELPTTVIAGRLPRGGDEIAVGPLTLRELAVEIGDDVQVGPDRVPMQVTGVVVANPSSGERLGGGVMLDRPAMDAVQESSPWYSALVRAADPERADDVLARYAAEYEVVAAEPPPEVRNLLDLGRLPTVLALLFVALTSAGLVHALLHVARRRGRELGVLMSLGFTRRQIAQTLVVMAGSVLAVGLVIGVPLGLAVGRLAWAAAATGTGVAADVAVPVGVLILMLPAAIVLAVVVSALPGARAARLRPADLLRDE